MRRGIGGGLFWLTNCRFITCNLSGEPLLQCKRRHTKQSFQNCKAHGWTSPRLGMKAPKETTCYPCLVVFAFDAIKFISRFIGVVISGTGKAEKKMCQCKIRTFQINNMAASYTQERRKEAFCDSAVSTSGLNLQQLLQN